MTATTEPKQIGKAAEVPAEKFEVTADEHAQAVKGLMSHTMKVAFTLTGLPKSKQASDEFVERVADEAEGQKEGFTVGKRLLSVDHQAIDGLNAAVRKVEKWRNQWTFPTVAAVEVDEPLTAAAAGKTLRRLAKEKGQRLIRIDDIDEFEAGLAQMDMDLAQACKRLRDDYDQIIALEKKRLGKQFDASDYPARDKLYSEEPSVDPETGQVRNAVTSMVRIGRRQYSEVTASVRLPQAVLQRMTVQAAETMNQNLEVIVEDTAALLTETFSTLAKQLVDRVQVRPRVGTPEYQKWGDRAEVLSLKKHDDDPQVPAGQVLLEVSYKVGKQTVKEAHGPIPEDEYQKLRPETMDETKKLSKSVIERLRDQLDLYSGLQDRLGKYGGHMDKTLDAVRDLISKATGMRKDKDSAVVEQIKGSSYYRATLKETLDAAGEVLQNVATTAKTVRRSIQGGIAAKLRAKMEAAK